MSNSSFEITFLGTCACDYSPKLETEFKNRFDKNARRSSCTLMNDCYLIDGGDHLLDSLRIYGKNGNEIDDMFISHLHRDHYNRDHIAKIAEGKKEPLRLWVREDAVIEEIYFNNCKFTVSGAEGDPAPFFSNVRGLHLADTTFDIVGPSKPFCQFDQ